MVESAISTFIEQNIWTIIIGVGTLVGFILLYRYLRPVPRQVDYIKVFNEGTIRDEALNVPHAYHPRWLYRGEGRLGKIVNIHSAIVDYKPTKEEREKGQIYDDWKKTLVTIVFREKTFWKFYLNEKKILRFEEGEATYRDDKLIFPSDCAFTAMGKEYMTIGSFQYTSPIVEGNWNKRMLEANVNIMASKMASIASETPEMAHELSLKRLDIERIRAEKETKMSGLI